MTKYLPDLRFPIYSGWTQYTPVIPKIYWDVYSQEQRIKNLCLSFDKVEHYLDYVAEEMNAWNIEFSEEIEQEFADMWQAIHDEYEEQLNEWIRTDGERIFKEMFSQVYFGLTDDGYFCAYTPESWDDITFDTGARFGHFDYGRLILRFTADGSGVIDNTGRYDDASTDGILARIADLEARVFNNETTLYTNMG